MKAVLKTGPLAAILFLLAVGPSPAETEDVPRFRYDTCLERMQYDAAAAYEIGRSWSAQGGGSQAQHCAALALVELGDFTEAAMILTDIAQNAKDLSGETMRATILSQAGNAWLLAGNGDAAYRVLSTAINIRLTDAQIYYDRARASALKKDFAAAEADLTRALSFQPNWLAAKLLRATARRHLGRIDTATADITDVLTGDPHNTDALLEKGLLDQIMGNEEAARANWLQAMALAQDSALEGGSADDAADVVDTVQRYLEALELSAPPN